MGQRFTFRQLMLVCSCLGGSSAFWIGVLVCLGGAQYDTGTWIQWQFILRFSLGPFSLASVSFFMSQNVFWHF